MDYKRFISYLYSYIEGKKGVNVGYIRCEQRQGVCRFTLNIQDRHGIEDGRYKVYLYKMTEEGVPIGYYLDDVVLHRFGGDLRKQTNSQNVWNTGNRIEDFDGVIAIYDVNHIYVSQWSDEAVNTYRFITWQDWSKERTTSKSMRTENADRRTAQDKLMQADYARMKAAQGEAIQADYDELKAAQGEAMQADYGELKAAQGEAMQADYAGMKAAQGEAMQADYAGMKAAQGEAMQADYAGMKVAQGEAIQADYDELKAAQGEAMQADYAGMKAAQGEAMQAGYAGMKAAQVETVQRENQGLNAEQENYDSTENRVEGVENNASMTPENVGDNGLERKARQDGESGKGSGKGKKTPTISSLTIRLMENRPKLPDFENHEIYDCVRIEPNDIGLLEMENWRLGVNSFLTHGFYNYKYLMLGKLRFQDGAVKAVLGVPGVYDNKEQYIAKIFGFEVFVPVKHTNTKTGNFGYWIVELV